MLSGILSMLKRLEVCHCSIFIRKVGSYFPLCGGNTCATYKLKRLHNDIALYLFKTSLVIIITKVAGVISRLYQLEIILMLNQSREICIESEFWVISNQFTEVKKRLNSHNIVACWSNPVAWPGSDLISLLYGDLFCDKQSAAILNSEDESFIFTFKMQS